MYIKKPKISENKKAGGIIIETGERSLQIHAVLLDVLVIFIYVDIHRHFLESAKVNMCPYANQQSASCINHCCKQLFQGHNPIYNPRNSLIVNK